MGEPTGSPAKHTEQAKAEHAGDVPAGAADVAIRERLNRGRIYQGQENSLAPGYIRYIDLSSND